MEGLCPCGHEPAGSIVPVSQLVSYDLFLKNRKLQEIFGLQIYVYKDEFDYNMYIGNTDMMP